MPKNKKQFVEPIPIKLNFKPMEQQTCPFCKADTLVIDSTNTDRVNCLTCGVGGSIHSVIRLDQEVRSKQITE